MEWVETNAKTVEQAKELALDQLHVDESEAEFEILEEPRPGLFGRVRGEARVRARVRPVQPRPKVDRRDRRRSGRKQRDDGPASDRGAEPSGRDGDDGPAVGDDSAAGARAPGGRSRNRSRNRSRSSERGAGSPDPTSRSQRARSTEQPDHTPRSEDPTVSDTIDAGDVSAMEQAAIVQEFVEGLLDAFGHSAEVSIVEIDHETAEVNVVGEDLGLLVGPKGNTIQAIHELSRSVIQRRASGTHHGRVRLDIAGYREKRREALERFTQRLAQQAIDSGVAQVLEPMSPADRKVVHDTANDIEGVHTVSEGEDHRRHVVIVPDEA